MVIKLTWLKYWFASRFLTELTFESLEALFTKQRSICIIKNALFCMPVEKLRIVAVAQTEFK